MITRTIRFSLLALTLLALPPTLAACGKKGDPVRPGEEPTQENPF